MGKLKDIELEREERENAIRNTFPRCRVIPYGDYRNDEEEKKRWVELRKDFIGGSDAGAFNPQSKYKSPFLLALNKKGITSFSGNAATHRGDIMERFIREELEKRKGVKILTADFMLVDSNGVSSCNLDGYFFENGELKIVELKTARSHEGWTKTSCPTDYYYQCQHNMKVSGAKSCLLACYFLDNDELQEMEIAADEEFQEELFKKEKDFNLKLNRGEAFEPKGLESEKNYFSTLAPNLEESGEISLIDEIEELVELKAEVKEKEKRIAELELKVKNEMVANNFKKATCGDHSINWITTSSKRFSSTWLKEDQPELYEQYKKEVTSDYIKVK